MEKALLVLALAVAPRDRKRTVTLSPGDDIGPVETRVRVAWRAQGGVQCAVELTAYRDSAAIGIDATLGKGAQSQGVYTSSDRARVVSFVKDWLDNSWVLRLSTPAAS